MPGFTLRVDGALVGARTSPFALTGLYPLRLVFSGLTEVDFRLGSALDGRGWQERYCWW
jgi:hypothetical protein